jgi:quercetin dioxygenase-like cupin family protein
MAFDIYQPFTNPITLETFRCLSQTAEAYTMEWIVQPHGFVPFEHIHIYQDEVFHIKQGKIRAVINGQVQYGTPGQVVTVPRGVRHKAYNDSDDVLVCVVEYRPALDIFKSFQCFGGLTCDHDLDRRYGINIPKMMYFMKKMDVNSLARPAAVPAPVFNLFMTFFHMVGSLAGWEKLYRKYTE